MLAFKEYLRLLFQQIPDCTFIYGLLVLLVGSVVIIAFAGIKEWIRLIPVLLLAEYIALILCSTVIFRSNVGIPKVVLIPFKGLCEEGVSIDPESVMNILVYIPLGILLELVFEGGRWRGCLLIGVFVSFLTEILQYIFRKGVCEIDDVLLNTVGLCVGGLLFFAMRSVFYRVKQK